MENNVKENIDTHNIQKEKGRKGHKFLKIVSKERAIASFLALNYFRNDPVNCQCRYMWSLAQLINADKSPGPPASPQHRRPQDCLFNQLFSSCQLTS